MQPKVSIIVPCWGVEKYLNRCVDSLVNQTLKEIQIILVDDESPDRVPQMCEKWAQKDLRIKVIHKKNGGLGMARNSGLEKAVGEYVTFLDADDYVETNTYENLYKEAKEKDLDICYYKHRRFWENGKQIDVNKDFNRYIFSGKNEIEEFKLVMVGANPFKPVSTRFSMSVCMALFKLSTLRKSGVIFPSEREVASEDLLFHVRYLPHVNKVEVLPDVYYNYFVNPSSITTTFNEAKYHRMRKLLEIIKSELLKTHTWDEIKYHYYSQQLRIIKIVLNFDSKSVKGIKHSLDLIAKRCDDCIYSDLYRENNLKGYSFIDRCVIFLMKNKLTLPIYLIYKYGK